PPVVLIEGRRLSHCARRELTPDRLDQDRRGRAYKSFQNYAEIRTRQSFSGAWPHSRHQSRLGLLPLRYTQIMGFRRREFVTLLKSLYMKIVEQGSSRHAL